MTLRNRVLLAMAVVAVVLVLAAFVITRVTGAYLLDRVDAQLAGIAPQVDDRDGPGGDGPDDDLRPPMFSSAYIAKVDESGTVVSQVTPNLTENETGPNLDSEQVLAEGGEVEPAPFTVEGRDGGPSYRLLARTDPDTGYTVVVGLSLGEVEAAVDRLAVVELVAVGFVLVVLGLVTVWVVRLGVRPIKRMTATATAIAAGDLSHRADPAHPGTEAADLAVALNTMLGRIETAFDERTESEARLRQFVADASHELRTPLTAIRGYADLYRHGGLRQPEELGPAMRRVDQEATRMARLIDDLLLLARLDQGRPLEQHPIDLSELAADAVRDARAVAPDRPIELAAPEALLVTGDDHRLRQVIGNLVANALVHTPATAPVRISTFRRDGRATLEVADRGPGMTAEATAHAFDRFWRADTARSRADGGSGLGLAIAKAIVEAHGGTVGLRSALGEGTTVSVELPLAPAGATTAPRQPVPH